MLATRTRRRAPIKLDSPASPDELANAWLHITRYLPPRQFINPIAGLTPARAVGYITWAQYGFKADLMWTYAAIERKGPVLRALKERRLSAIRKLKWVVRVKDEGKENEDRAVQAEVEAQTQVLKEVYGGIENLKEALGFLALATFRGYAHLEKHVDADNHITRLEPVPQWYWCFTYPVRDWLYNREALQTNAGEPIEPDAFVVREVEDPLDEIAIIIFLRKNLSKKDWDLFVETYGVPSIFAEFSADAQAARPSDLTAALQQIERIISNGRGALPPGVKITSTANVVGSGASSHPFQPHLEYQNMELVLAGTGGKLTMLSDATGIGQGASGAHEQVFQDIAEAEGEEICEILRAQIDGPELKRRGFERPLVEFALEVMKAEDKERNANILGAIAAAGYRTSDEQASEMLEMEVHSVMGGAGEENGDMYSEAEGEETETTRSPERSAGILADDTVAMSRADADGGNGGYQRRGAPFYDAAVLHHSAARQPRPAQPAPLWPADSAQSSVSNPDPPRMLTTYPDQERLDRYYRMMRLAIEGYKRSIAKGFNADLGPLREKVRALISLDNEDEMMNRLRELERELPQQLRKMLVNSEAVRAFERALTESVERGATPVPK
jgi:phage gp29-like protein